MKEQHGRDLTAWLEDIQRDMGIAYTDDDAEEHLRAIFAQVCATLDRAAVAGIRYHGYRERVRADGSRLRTTLRTLAGTVALDGQRYYLELTGPYDGTGTARCADQAPL